MGQTSSSFVYSPLEFSEYKVSSELTLESFLIKKLEALLHKKIDMYWKPTVDSMAHKIRCISEGWNVLPKIEFEILVNGTPRVVKVMEGV